MSLIRSSRNKYRKWMLFLCLCSGLLVTHTITASPLAESSIPLPAGIQYPIESQDTPEKKLNGLLGISYRIDGVITETGKYALFAKPNTYLATPGLNCSGFVLEASRFLLDKNITVSAAKVDRLLNSAKNSPYSEDWDFGWDLILNIAQDSPAIFILPNGERRDKNDPQVNGFSPRGFDLHSQQTWDELPSRLKPDNLYLVSFNRDSGKAPGIQHYHVGLIYVNDKGEIWLYQTTGKARKVYRRNLADKHQRDQFLRSFSSRSKLKKYILILEIPLS
ncbi:hypothetical protein [Pragia fontium]|uniref:hypothetical protein n=1 Tax=Pragia fontium TaxID=82985 RepID=UPI0011873856|nr:hypothetical protein [Pragia fontium]